jgi:hypothetical protein
MKRASTKDSGSLEAEKGNHSTRAPRRMTPAKLRIKMRAGGRCLDKKILALTLFILLKATLQSKSFLDHQ